MSPLNHLINYSAELAQSSSSFSKYFSSRLITAISIPIEMLAVLENTIKLPFQSAATIIKIPAKIINVALNSRSLNDFEEALSGPLDILKTALKIIGYAIGTFFSACGAIFSPYANFQLHYTLDLITDMGAERKKTIDQERKQKEIQIQEKILQTRLKEIVEAKREEITFLTEEQRNEIETITQIPYPPIEQIIEETDPLIPSATEENQNHEMDGIQDLKIEQPPVETTEQQQDTAEISIDLVNPASV